MLSPKLMQAKSILKKNVPGLLTAYRGLRHASGFNPGNKRRHLNDFIRQQTDSVVASGPFTGMTLVGDTSWGDGDIAPKLLGVYEQELHPWIERCASRRYNAIVDVGCAEGYYAVGLARLFGELTVYAFDTDQTALRIGRQAALTNGVQERIVFAAFCDHFALLDLSRAHERLLVISDCEGFEVDLFSDRRVLSALSRSDLIIECHDDQVAQCTATLVDALQPSHTVHRIESSGRNPNSFDFLADLHEMDRWQAVCENRPHRSHWLFCESKTAFSDS